MNAADYLEQRADQAKHEAEDRAAEILQLEARIEAFREYRAEALAREVEMRTGARLLRGAVTEERIAFGGTVTGLTSVVVGESGTETFAPDRPGRFGR